MRVSLPTTLIVGAVNAVIGLLIAFNVALDSSQQAAIVAVVNALLAVAAAFLDPKVPIGKQS